MLQGMGHLQGFGGSVLPAPSLLLCQAGSAAVPRGTGPAPLYGPGRDPLLQFGDALPARRLQVREGGAAVPGSGRPGSAPPPRLVPGTSRALLKQKLLLRNHLRADRRRQHFPALASLLLGAFWLRGEDKNPPVKSRHGMRGGGAALPDVQHS
ncbi:uncharacterized protein LOC115484461 isoform X2 [Serinus canaria]|uniref:uncharacterized protein LOC115484461 isoform X2 n=1 Tax=Serinus canaria TaxID=9135 RepID=UPI0021CC795F|nr:uncharacterized protein LOC115484461 isoform X2 [Serinus canaria]